MTGEQALNFLNDQCARAREVEVTVEVSDVTLISVRGIIRHWTADDPYAMEKLATPERAGVYYVGQTAVDVGSFEGANWFGNEPYTYGLAFER